MDAPKSPPTAAPLFNWAPQWQKRRDFIWNSDQTPEKSLEWLGLGSPKANLPSGNLT